MSCNTDGTAGRDFTASVTATSVLYGAANRTVLLATMIGCEPVYSVLSGIMQPDDTPPDIKAVSVAAACGGVSNSGILNMRVSVNVSEPAEVCHAALQSFFLPLSSTQQ